MSANLEIVRSLYANWERGDFSSTEWADPAIELVFPDGLQPSTWTGLLGLGEGFEDFLNTWEGLRAEPTEYRELDGGRVLVLVDFTGHGKTSGVDLGQMQTKNASLLELRNGKVTRLVLYWDRARAFADLGLEE